MRNIPNQTNHVRHRRSGSGHLIASVLLLLVFGGGAFVLWEKYGGFVAPSSLAAAQPSTSAPTAAEAPAAAQAPDDMAQSMKDLQASQQQIADKLDALQRQLASEQGERTLLSEQVAALSGRIRGLSGSNAQVTTGTAPQQATPQPAKKKPKLPDAKLPDAVH